jgi:hypothetical protein
MDFHIVSMPFVSVSMHGPPGKHNCTQDSLTQTGHEERGHGGQV